MKLKCVCLLCKPPPHFMVFGFLNENICLGKPSPGFLLGKCAATNAPPFLPPARLGQRGNYIILEMEWKHFTSKTKWNASLLAELPIKKQHLEHKGSAKKVRTPVTMRLKPVALCSTKAPRRMFFFLSFPSFSPWPYLQGAVDNTPSHWLRQAVCHQSLKVLIKPSLSLEYGTGAR